MMFKCTFSLVITTVVINTVLTSSQAEEGTYRAAVTEFAPKSYLVGNLLKVFTSRKTAQQNMMLNLDAMEKLAIGASDQGAKIIVFPEESVTGRIYCINCKKNVAAYAENIPPVITGNTTNPCTDSGYGSRPILQRLSCIARNHGIVLVANMPDIKGLKLFNTNVIFETDGTLIAKYYKQHLFRFESLFFDTTNRNRYVIFNTSFGVDFSVLICNDILYCDPALEMVNKGIKNFVFSAYWGNRYPHYTSISVRQGWSWRNQVNVLSSGINNALEEEIAGKVQKFYSSGSGIYSAGKPLDYYISGENFTEPSGRLIIADVPLEPGKVSSIANGQRLELIGLKSRDTPLEYQTLDPKQNSLVVTFESDIFDNLTCSLEYKFSYLASNEVFALAASIFPDEKNQDITYALCSLSRRPVNGTPQSIGYTTASKFQYIKLQGTFSQYPHITVMPFVLGNQLRLLDPSLFVLEEYQITLQNEEQDILVANLWGKIAGTNDGYCSDTEYTDSHQPQEWYSEANQV